MDELRLTESRVQRLCGRSAVICLAKIPDFHVFVLFLVIAIVALLAAVPLIYLVWNSFKPITLGNLADFSLTNFTLQNFVLAYSNPHTYTSLVNSILFAAGSMLVALAFGGAIAFFVERTDTPMRHLVYGLMLIPLIIPSVLKAIGWLLLLSSGGILNRIWLGLGFEQPVFTPASLIAMCWVEGMSMAPLTFLMLGAALRSMDPSLEEASFACGAGKLTTFGRVTLKLMMPAIAGIGLLQFIRGLEAFDVPLIMGMGEGIHVFSTTIYLSVREISPPNYGQAFVLSLFLTVLALLGLMMYQRVVANSGRYTTVTGKAFRPRLTPLGFWRWWAWGFIAFYIFVSSVLPFAIMLWTSLLPYYQHPSSHAMAIIGLDNYREVFSHHRFFVSLKNTFILAATVSVAGMTMAILVSWIVIRWKPKGARILDGLAFLPYTIPSVAIGYSFMMLFLAFPNPIYGTLWIIGLAYLTTFLPIGTRFSHAAVSQLHVELEEAAVASGAGFFNVMRRILVPLILPSLLAGGLYLFILSIKVLSTAAILWQPDSIVLSIYVFQLWNEGSLPAVSAAGVVMIIGVTGLGLVSRMLTQKLTVATEV